MNVHTEYIFHISSEDLIVIPSAMVARGNDLGQLQDAHLIQCLFVQ
jgi:hypothetical protein